jgi:hypothetical protein
MFKGSRDPSKYGLYISKETEQYNVMYKSVEEAKDFAELKPIL